MRTAGEVFFQATNAAAVAHGWSRPDSFGGTLGDPLDQLAVAFVTGAIVAGLLGGEDAFHIVEHEQATLLAEIAQEQGQLFIKAVGRLR